MLYCTVIYEFADKENSPSRKNIFSVQNKSVHNMLNMEVCVLESIHDISVVMIFSLKKLTLCVFHNCECISMLQV